MDDADRVDALSEFTARINLQNSRRDEPNVQPTGRCLYCDEPIIADDDRDVSRRRWCNAECRDEWELENQ